MLVSGQRETVRLAAAGDIHCSEENRDQVAAGFEEIRGRADLVLLAGDLTTYGEPGEAAVLADIVRGLELPVYVVLGNHDWHADRSDEVTAVLREAGIVVDAVATGVIMTRAGVVGLPDPLRMDDLFS